MKREKKNEKLFRWFRSKITNRTVKPPITSCFSTLPTLLLLSKSSFQFFYWKKLTIGDIENDAENDAFAFFWFIHEMRPLRMLACLQKTFSDEQGPSNLIVWKLPLRYKHVGNKNTDKTLKEKKWSFENCYLNLKTGQPIWKLKHC